uniref:PHB domain-containing protein n=1 Tax=Macrostomum lignano TaxID=282301 RepID=A0A1I8IWJ9_9PLAT
LIHASFEHTRSASLPLCSRHHPCAAVHRELYSKVDLRTVSFDVPPQEVLTKDSVTVSVDAVVYYRVNKCHSLGGKRGERAPLHQAAGPNHPEERARPPRTWPRSCPNGRASATPCRCEPMQEAILVRHGRNTFGESAQFRSSFFGLPWQIRNPLGEFGLMPDGTPPCRDGTGPTSGPAGTAPEGPGTAAALIPHSPAVDHPLLPPAISLSNAAENVASPTRGSPKPFGRQLDCRQGRHRPAKRVARHQNRVSRIRRTDLGKRRLQFRPDRPLSHAEVRLHPASDRGRHRRRFEHAEQFDNQLPVLVGAAEDDLEKDDGGCQYKTCASQYKTHTQTSTRLTNRPVQD